MRGIQEIAVQSAVWEGVSLDERADFVDLGTLPHAILHVQRRLRLEHLP
jgi:hypothetical protein